MRCKALLLARRMVSQILKSDSMGPIWSLLKSPESPRLSETSDFSRSAEIQSFGLPATSKVTRSAPNGLKVKFDPPFDASGSGLASTRQNNILRRVREAITFFFENWVKMKFSMSN